MKTVKENNSQTYRNRGSKFIGYLFGCSSREKFEQQLAKVKKEHPNATHHCYAWRIGPAGVREFANDDGEPSGTAGLPILNQLKSFDVVNAGLVVVRYFGGTKLGKPGLIEAYGHTARVCLEKAALPRIQPTLNFRLRFPYSQQNRIDQLMNTYNLQTLESEYTEEVAMTVACPMSVSGSCLEEVKRLEHLGIEFKEAGTGYLITS